MTSSLLFNVHDFALNIQSYLLPNEVAIIESVSHQSKNFTTSYWNALAKKVKPIRWRDDNGDFSSNKLNCILQEYFYEFQKEYNKYLLHFDELNKTQAKEHVHYFLGKLKKQQRSFTLKYHRNALEEFARNFWDRKQDFLKLNSSMKCFIWTFIRFQSDHRKYPDYENEGEKMVRLVEISNSAIDALLLAKMKGNYNFGFNSGRLKPNFLKNFKKTPSELIKIAVENGISSNTYYFNFKITDYIFNEEFKFLALASARRGDDRALSFLEGVHKEEETIRQQEILKRKKDPLEISEGLFTVRDESASSVSQESKEENED